MEDNRMYNMEVSPKEIFEQMKTNIHDNFYKSNYSQISKGYISSRTSIFSLLHKISNKMCFRSQTYFLSIYYLDIIFSKNNQSSISVTNYKLLGLSCLLLAAKYCENDPLVPELQYFVKIFNDIINSRSAISVKDLFLAEVITCKLLNYKLNYYTVYDFNSFFFGHGIIKIEQLKELSNNINFNIINIIDNKNNNNQKFFQDIQNSGFIKKILEKIYKKCRNYLEIVIRNERICLKYNSLLISIYIMKKSVEEVLLEENGIMNKKIQNKNNENEKRNFVAKCNKYFKDIMNDFYKIDIDSILEYQDLINDNEIRKIFNEELIEDMNPAQVCLNELLKKSLKENKNKINNKDSSSIDYDTKTEYKRKKNVIVNTTNKSENINENKSEIDHSNNNIDSTSLYTTANKKQRKMITLNSSHCYKGKMSILKKQNFGCANNILLNENNYLIDIDEINNNFNSTLNNKKINENEKNKENDFFFDSYNYQNSDAQFNTYLQKISNYKTMKKTISSFGKKNSIKENIINNSNTLSKNNYKKYILSKDKKSIINNNDFDNMDTIDNYKSSELSSPIIFEKISPDNKYNYYTKLNKCIFPRKINRKYATSSKFRINKSFTTDFPGEMKFLNGSVERLAREVEMNNTNSQFNNLNIINNISTINNSIDNITSNNNNNNTIQHHHYNNNNYINITNINMNNINNMNTSQNLESKVDLTMRPYYKKIIQQNNNNNNSINKNIHIKNLNSISNKKYSSYGLPTLLSSTTNTEGNENKDKDIIKEKEKEKEKERKDKYYNYCCFSKVKVKKIEENSFSEDNKNRKLSIDNLKDNYKNINNNINNNTMNEMNNNYFIVGENARRSLDFNESTYKKNLENKNNNTMTNTNSKKLSDFFNKTITTINSLKHYYNNKSTKNNNTTCNELNNMSKSKSKSYDKQKELNDSNDNIDYNNKENNLTLNANININNLNNINININNLKSVNFDKLNLNYEDRTINVKDSNSNNNSTKNIHNKNNNNNLDKGSLKSDRFPKTNFYKKLNNNISSNFAKNKMIPIEKKSTMNSININNINKRLCEPNYNNIINNNKYFNQFSKSYKLIDKNEQSNLFNNSSNNQLNVYSNSNNPNSNNKKGYNKKIIEINSFNLKNINSAKHKPFLFKSNDLSTKLKEINNLNCANSNNNLSKNSYYNRNSNIKKIEQNVENNGKNDIINKTIDNNNENKNNEIKRIATNRYHSIRKKYLNLNNNKKNDINSNNYNNINNNSKEKENDEVFSNRRNNNNLICYSNKTEPLNNINIVSITKVNNNFINNSKDKDNNNNTNNNKNLIINNTERKTTNEKLSLYRFMQRTKSKEIPIRNNSNLNSNNKEKIDNEQNNKNNNQQDSSKYNKVDNLNYSTKKTNNNRLLFGSMRKNYFNNRKNIINNDYNENSSNNNLIQVNKHEKVNITDGKNIENNNNNKTMPVEKKNYILNLEDGRDNSSNNIKDNSKEKVDSDSDDNNSNNKKNKNNLYRNTFYRTLLNNRMKRNNYNKQISSQKNPQENQNKNLSSPPDKRESNKESITRVAFKYYRNKHIEENTETKENKESNDKDNSCGKKENGSSNLRKNFKKSITIELYDTYQKKKRNIKNRIKMNVVNGTNSFGNSSNKSNSSNGLDDIQDIQDKDKNEEIQQQPALLEKEVPCKRNYENRKRRSYLANKENNKNK